MRRDKRKRRQREKAMASSRLPVSLSPCLLVFLSCLLLPGCVHRIMTVKSEPDGALVYMNEQEIGRTPLSKEFLWYGNYDVVVRKEGYATLKTQTPVMPPLWQIIPIDLVTDLMPLTDEHVLVYHLQPSSPSDPAALMAHAEDMRAMLESSEHTKTKPTTHPTTQASTVDSNKKAPDVHPGLR
jgi:hypothetical protein